MTEGGLLTRKKKLRYFSFIVVWLIVLIMTTPVFCAQLSLELILQIRLIDQAVVFTD